eukprot:1140754-Pelagomonas_calceolata.AAC.1
MLDLPVVDDEGAEIVIDAPISSVPNTSSCWLQNRIRAREKRATISAAAQGSSTWSTWKVRRDY